MVNGTAVIQLLAAVPLSVTGQIKDRIENAMLFGVIAAVTAIVAVILFFVFHIPRCIDAVTGIGRRRELAKMRKKKKLSGVTSCSSTDARTAARQYMLSSDDSYRNRPLPEGFIIEQELP